MENIDGKNRAFKLNTLLPVLLAPLFHPFPWRWRLTGKLKYSCLRTDLFKCTRSATEMGLKAPDFTESLAILATSYSTVYLVLGCDLTRFGNGDIPMGTMVHFLRNKEGTWLNRPDHDGAGIGRDPYHVALPPVMMGTLRHGRL